MSRPIEHVTDALQPAVGLILERLCIRTFEYDIQSESDLRVDCLHVGGELRLDFSGHSLFVSGVQGLYSLGEPSVAVEDDCCIAARTSSFYVPTAELVEWDLGQSQPLDVLLGNPLESARVLALLHFPNIVELMLGGNRLVLANSFKWEVGTGDDLLIGLRPDLVPHSVKELWAT